MSMYVQVEFMKRHSFAYEALAGEEYEALRPDLVKVQESIGNTAFAAEIKQSASRDAFFKAGLIYPPQQPLIKMYIAPSLYFLRTMVEETSSAAYQRMQQASQ